MHKATRGRSGLHAVRTPGPLSGPVGIVRDLPSSFWHPSFGELAALEMPEEELVGDDEDDDKKPPSWLMKAGGTVFALCFLAIIVAGTVRVVDWILEGM